MPRKPKPPGRGEPEPEHTIEVTARVEVTIDGKSVDEFLEDADNFFDKMASMTTKADDESLAARIRASIAAKSDDELEDIDRDWLAFDAERAKYRKTPPVPLPKRGDTLQADKAPAFARVRVTKLGSFNTIGDDTELLGTVVILWTGTQENHNPFSGEVRVRGVLTPENPSAWRAGELSWLSADGEVELIDPPTYIGQPEDFIPATAPVDLPEKTSRDMFYNWPSLIWDAMTLYEAMAPLIDCQSATEIILCALKVAPPVAQLQAFLLSGLKARYAEYTKDTFWDDPWLHDAGPDWLNGLVSTAFHDFDTETENDNDVEPEDEGPHRGLPLELLMDREDIEDQIENVKRIKALPGIDAKLHLELDDQIEELQAFLHSLDDGEELEAFSGVGEAFCRAWHEGHRPTENR